MQNPWLKKCQNIRASIRQIKIKRGSLLPGRWQSRDYLCEMVKERVNIRKEKGKKPLSQRTKLRKSFRNAPRKAWGMRRQNEWTREYYVTAAPPNQASFSPGHCPSQKEEELVSCSAPGSTCKTLKHASTTVSGKQPALLGTQSEPKLFSGVPRGETGTFTIPIISLPYHGAGEQIAGDLLPGKIKAGKKLISSKEVQKQRRMTRAPTTLLQRKD